MFFYCHFLEVFLSSAQTVYTFRIPRTLVHPSILDLRQLTSNPFPVGQASGAKLTFLKSVNEKGPQHETFGPLSRPVGQLPEPPN